MEVPQNAAQPEHVAEPNSPAVDDFQEEDVAGDETVSEAMATMEISSSQAVRDAVPQLHDYFAYKLMVSLA